MLFTFVYLFVLILMSFITMICYGIDKRKAVKEKMRIPEKALFCIGLFGGAIGALFGMVLFSHKTKKIYFWLINILFLVVQIVILSLILYLEVRINFM